LRTLFTILLLAVLGAGVWFAGSLLTPIQPSGQKFVLLRPGYSTRRIAAELKNAGVICSVPVFLVWHQFHKNRSLKAGEYLFEKSVDLREVHSRLAHGDVYIHTVVIPEGYTIFDIAQAIQDSGLGQKQEFLAAATVLTPLITDLDPQAQSLEGYLFPDTYEFTRTLSIEDMIELMVKRFRREAQAIGLTTDMHRTVTMASIIEKETAAADERPLVASVYYNRLEKKIALDADPSVIYAELLSGTYGGGLHHADMQVDSPYNTYRHAGLPPGPIGNPGRTSLEAALHPATSGFFYFVSNGNGHHRFAKSLEEHNRNVAAYRKAMSAKEVRP